MRRATTAISKRWRAKTDSTCWTWSRPSTRPRSDQRRIANMQVIKPSRKKLRRQGHQPLDVFFSPKTVAVVGATENINSVGRTVLWNLVTSPFGGTVRSEEHTSE